MTRNIISDDDLLAFLKNYTTPDGWLLNNNGTTNNSFFDTQWISASYPISGGYGTVPRYLYYALILFSFVTRYRLWVAKAAFGTVLIYSSVAAVHSIVLFGLENDQWSKKEEIWLPDYGLWLAMVPRVWDEDIDATFAIAGAAFMATVTYPPSRSPARDSSDLGITIWILWTTLCMVGSYVTYGLRFQAQIVPQIGPQMRFCPLGQSDTLPLINSGAQDLVELLPSQNTDWNRTIQDHFNTSGAQDLVELLPSQNTDWNRTIQDHFNTSGAQDLVELLPSQNTDWNLYSWNRTIQDHFVTKNGTSNALRNICIYPPFKTSWKLRDRTEIFIDRVHYRYFEFQRAAKYMIYLQFYAMLSAPFTIEHILLSMVEDLLSPATCSILTSKVWLKKPTFDFGFMTFIAPLQYFKWLKQATAIMNRIFDEIIQNPRTSPIRRIMFIILRPISILSTLFAWTISSVLWLPFVVIVEREIWLRDSTGESFRHVGQWGAIVGVLLPILGTLISHYCGKNGDSDNSLPDHGSPPEGTPLLVDLNNPTITNPTNTNPTNTNPTNTNPTNTNPSNNATPSHDDTPSDDVRPPDDVTPPDDVRPPDEATPSTHTPNTQDPSPPSNTETSPNTRLHPNAQSARSTIFYDSRQSQNMPTPLVPLYVRPTRSLTM